MAPALRSGAAHSSCTQLVPCGLCIRSRVSQRSLAGRELSSGWLRLWETEINSALTSLEIQATLMVSLLSQVPGLRLPWALPRDDAPLCLPQPRVRAGAFSSGASMPPFTCRAQCLCSAVPMVLRGCVTARPLLPYSHTAVASHCSTA